MKRLSIRPGKALFLFLVIGVLLSSCGNNLWGTYAPYLTLTPGVTGTIPTAPEPTRSELFTPTHTPLAGLTPTATVSLPTNTPAPTIVTGVPGSTIFYTSQSGDSLNVVAVHFGIQPADIRAEVALPASGFINPGTLLLLPVSLSQGPTTPSQQIIPDSELVEFSEFGWL